MPPRQRSCISTLGTSEAADAYGHDVSHACAMMCKCLCGGDSAHVQGRARGLGFPRTQFLAGCKHLEHAAWYCGDWLQFNVLRINAAPGPAPGGLQPWRPARRSPHAASTTRALARQLCKTLGIVGCVCGTWPSSRRSSALETSVALVARRAPVRVFCTTDSSSSSPSPRGPVPSGSCVRDTR